MAGDLLLTGLSGLNAFRSVLNTTGHNIANVTTEGYSRQTVELDSRNPQLTGGGYVGSGVQSTTVSRLYDSFLATQFRSSSSATADLDSYLNFANQVDSVLADQNIGLSVALQDFFNAVQTVADDPTSIPARQTLLTEGEVIENRFNTLDRLFSSLTTQVNSSLNDTVFDINTYAEGIAQLNEQIVLATGVGGGNIPNDLLDKRDQLIDQLSEKVNVSTSLQEDGALNVFVGSGQALVLGNIFNTLGVQQSLTDATVKDIVFKQSGADLVVTKFMTGGEIGGTLRFRDEMLDPAIQSLGEIAIGLSAAVNAQHINGVDLNGAQGQNFFNEPSVSLVAGGANTGTLGVTFDPATTASLKEGNYLLTYDGVNYTLTPPSGTPANINDGDVVDGLVFDLSGVVSGDSYTITPPRVKDVAGTFSFGIVDPREIAAAVAVVAQVPSVNLGTGDIGNISTSGLNLAGLSGSLPITITFNAGYTDSTGTLAYDSSTDTYNIDTGSGVINFTLIGTPQDGDTIVLSSNSGGIGDNRNANLLSDLQTALSMSGGTASFKDSYGQLVADVGRRTQSAEANGLAQHALLAQTTAAKDTVSGVNLDEEAANLIRFQQAYQA
ncbi:MAG: flagellar hook-associated protein [Cycloclasticus sp. symbiont of Bathymodiolus heckerae]|nr:MAG: flagellar hook-associated protein [Cycloclasticus sp. symbiont of Bathymodiolus heckerae]